MIQASTTTWAVIIITDIIFILIGFYCGYKVVRAILDGRDLMKYQGYMVVAFLSIFLFPFLITYGGLAFSSAYYGKQPIVGISIKTTDGGSETGHISLMTNSLDLSKKENTIKLKIENPLTISQDLTINIVCQSSKEKCAEIMEDITPIDNTVKLTPKVVLELPISIKVTDNVSLGDYSFNITAKYKNGSVFDSIPLVITVK